MSKRQFFIAYALMAANAEKNSVPTMFSGQGSEAINWNVDCAEGVVDDGADGTGCALAWCATLDICVTARVEFPDVPAAVDRKLIGNTVLDACCEAAIPAVVAGSATVPVMLPLVLIICPMYEP